MEIPSLKDNVVYPNVSPSMIHGSSISQAFGIRILSFTVYGPAIKQIAQMILMHTKI